MENTTTETSASIITEKPVVTRRRRRAFKEFSDALAFVRALGIKSRKEWRLWIKGELEGVARKPDDVPAHPDGVYKISGWQGWRHWLGTGAKDLH